MSQPKVSISVDKTRLDLGLIHEYLSEESYWAKGRSRELVEKSIANSLCFGAFDEEDNQIGFARIATDYVVFAWLMDVFVVSNYQGKGVGKQLLKAIVEHPDLSEVNGIGLRTEDAQEFYLGFGFEAIPKPETWMLKTKN